MASFVEANRLYNEGKYQEALNLYLKLKDIYGGQIVEFSIKKCQENLNCQVQVTDNRETNILQSLSKCSNQPKMSVKNSFLNDYFDKIYVVNLDFQIEKRLKICNHLNSNGIKYEIFKAINGYATPIKDQFDEYTKKTLGSLLRYTEWNDREIKRGKHYIESAGAMGYLHTYINLIKQAKDKKLNKILILEDDILLSESFERDFIKFSNSVGDNWKILQLGASQYNWDSVEHDKALELGFYYPRLLDTCGSFAIAINMSVADELIDELMSFEAPFDHIPLGTVYERYLEECYVCYPNIVMPDVGVSYIRGERNQYEHSKKMRWIIDNFNYPLQKVSVGLIVTDRAQIKYVNSFTVASKSVFDLRLFYISSDGIRPIHNLDYFLTNQDNIINDMDNLSTICLDVDILGNMIGKIPVTERDIVSFIQNQLGITSEKSKCINNLTLPKQTYTPNMVSVIIPTYKRKETVLSAIYSVIHQDYDLKEIIVVSDNDEAEYNDYLCQKINELKEEYLNTNIKYIQHSKNRNGSAARNTGIFYSQGEYICFLDDDDVYLQGRLSASVEVLKNHKHTNIQAVYCGFLGWNSLENDLNRYTVGDLTKELLMINYKAHYLHTNTGTYTRKALLKLQGFDEFYRRHQDFEFSLRYFELYKIDVVKQALVRLKPEPVPNSNLLRNFEFIKLKINFLSQFDGIISKFGEKVAKEIYQAHYNDLLRYCNLDDISKQGFDIDFRNVWLFFLNKKISK